MGKNVRHEDYETLSGDGGLEDILQLLKEQSLKMGKLGLALKVIQDRMRQNTPVIIKTSVGQAAEVLDSLLNTHKCLLQSEVEIQKRLKSHPASRKMGIFLRPRSASLGDTAKTQSKGEKREAPSPPEEQIAKKRKGSSSFSYSEAARSGGTKRKAAKEIGKWQVVEKKNLKQGQRRKKCRRHTRKKVLPFEKARNQAVGEKADVRS